MKVRLHFVAIAMATSLLSNVELAGQDEPQAAPEVVRTMPGTLSSTTMFARSPNDPTGYDSWEVWQGHGCRGQTACQQGASWRCRCNLFHWLMPWNAPSTSHAPCDDCHAQAPQPAAKLPPLAEPELEHEVEHELEEEMGPKLPVNPIPQARRWLQQVSRPVYLLRPREETPARRVSKVDRLQPTPASASSAAIVLKPVNKTTLKQSTVPEKQPVIAGPVLPLMLD